MSEAFTREAAIASLRSLAERTDIEADQARALEYAIALATIDAEEGVVETHEGEQTILVELTDGVTYTDPQTGQAVHADVVRLRRPSIADEWRRDALAREVTGLSVPPNAALEMALVAQLIVEWRGLPIPDMQKHLATLSRYDAGRLIQAVYALEDYAERVAREGKLKRRTSSP